MDYRARNSRRHHSSRHYSSRHHSSRHHSSRPIQWLDEYTDYLVRLRRRRNDEFYNSYGRDRTEFWNSIAQRFICILFIMLK